MSHDPKGRTMIGTAPPIAPPRAATTLNHPRPAQATGPHQPTITPPGQGLPLPAPLASPVPAAPPSLAGPTVGMRGAGTVPPPSDDPDIVVGQDLGGYVIRRKLAEGGMGVVYEGIHSKIGRIGAIKVLKRELCRSEDMVERFYQEARAVNSIRHENIVDISDFGRDPYGRVFFVMEFLEGEPLSARIGRGALAWPEAFPILEQTLRALKAAHDKGYVHRDLKPDNIWLRYVEGRAQVKLLDFGIAKLVGAESPREKLTQTGSVIGTPHYMSPEQINGSRDVDHRTDIYALGVIMYEMFAGVTPFGGETLQAVMTGHLFREPPRLVELPAHLTMPGPMPGLVDRMLARLLAKDAAARYDSVADVLADLRDVGRQRTPAKAETLERTRPATPTVLGGRAAAAPPRKTRRGLVIGGAVVVAGIAVAVIAISQSQEAPTVVTNTTTTPPTPPTKIVETPPPPPSWEQLRANAQLTLRGSLHEAEPAIRVEGSDALGKIKDQPSTPTLTELTEKDPDAGVRGHTAGALGQIGATDTAQLLAKLETAAPPPLKVWYAEALAHVGDKAAITRLFGYVRDPALAVSYKAATALGKLARPGDKKAIAAMRAVVGQIGKTMQPGQTYQAQLTALTELATVLGELSTLRDPDARKQLYQGLQDPDEAARLAVAEVLAQLGDDESKPVLQSVFAHSSSPENQLVAAVAQIPLGEYAAATFIKALGAPRPGIRVLAARALGEIADRSSLDALVAATRDPEWTVRIAAATAVISIVGISPQVLAQASVDWTKSALDSQDLAVREAAAGVLADIPEAQAVPLLARAISDKDPKVRIKALKSAGKMHSADAASKVVAAVATETDPAVKEQQIAALGQIGNPVAHDTLAQIAAGPGRIGVLAAGSLISVGDPAGETRLEAAVVAPDVGMRLAAVQAASATTKALVIPTLKLGVIDRIFDVRFVAAEGLAMQNAEKAAAVPVLNAGLESKDAEIYGRAMAALTRLGEIGKGPRSPSDMLDAPDPKLRLAAVSVVRALPPSEAVPLLRRLVADPDSDVRHAGVDAIEVVVVKDKDEAIKLYRPLVNDMDPFVRSKASGQLSRLVPPEPTRAPQPMLAPQPPTTPRPPAGDPKLGEVQGAFDKTAAAAADARPATDAVTALITELTTTTSGHASDDAALDHARELVANLEAAITNLDGIVGKTDDGAKATADVEGASRTQEAAELVDRAAALARDTRAAVTDVHTKATAALARGHKWLDDEAVNPEDLLREAEAEIAAKDHGSARRHVDQAAAAYRKKHLVNPLVDYLNGQIYDGMAEQARDNPAKLKLLHQAEDAYRRYAKAGTGARATKVKARLGEIADEIKDLGPQ
jgi:serine/threonine-protein kinase